MHAISDRMTLEIAHIPNDPTVLSIRLVGEVSSCVNLNHPNSGPHFRWNMLMADTMDVSLSLKFI